jgi:hypothetical protein
LGCRYLNKIKLIIDAVSESLHVGSIYGQTSRFYVAGGRVFVYNEKDGHEVTGDVKSAILSNLGTYSSIVDIAVEDVQRVLA